MLFLIIDFYSLTTTWHSGHKSKQVTVSEQISRLSFRRHRKSTSNNS